MKPKTSSDSANNGGKTAAEDDSGIAHVPQPTTEAQVRRVSTSSISSGCRVAGRAASYGSHLVTEASPVGPRHISLNSRTSTQASKGEVLVIQSPKVTNPTLQGKQTAGSTACSSENDATSKSLSKGKFNGCTSEIKHVQENEKCLKEAMPFSPNKEPCVIAEMKSEGRKSSRLLADGRTSLERAVELKKIRSLEKTKATKATTSSRQGSDSAEQADLARVPSVVKQAPATANYRVPRPSVSGSSCTSSKVPQVLRKTVAKACQSGHNTVPKMSIQSGMGRTSAIHPPDAVSPDILSQEPQKTSAGSSVDKVPAVVAMATAAPKTSTHASLRISARCSNDKGVIASPAILPLPFKGKRSALSITEVKTDANVTKSPSKKSNTLCVTKQNNVPKVPHKDDSPKHKDQYDTKFEHLNKDSAHPSLAKKNSARALLQQKPTHHIQSGELFSNPPLEPLGERCHLCGIDLAFTQSSSDSRRGDLPFSAVLPCCHSYHDNCLNDLFGTCEPPCVRCLEGEASNGR